MSNSNSYAGGGAEYSGPQYAQPSMRPVGSQPAAPTYDAGADPWGKSAAPSASAAVTPAASEGVVNFSRPYMAHGEEVRRIKLRRPSALDLRRCGYPMRAVLNPETQMMEGLDFVPANITKMIVALSSPSLPPSTVDSFDLDDYEKCSKVVCGFFTG